MSSTFIMCIGTFRVRGRIPPTVEHNCRVGGISLSRWRIENLEDQCLFTLSKSSL